MPYQEQSSDAASMHIGDLQPRVASYVHERSTNPRLPARPRHRRPRRRGRPRRMLGSRRGIRRDRRRPRR
ncbi:hypothetical protein DZF93_20310, partial [Clavibacter michiganensis subsp. insidiosus]